MKIDLHCHSHYSDGSASYRQILELLTKEKIKHFSITDHDFFGGELDAFFLSKDIRYYNGIEISAKDYDSDRKLHLLSYGFDKDNKRLKEYTEYYFNLRKENSLGIIYRLKNEGFNITTDDFSDRIHYDLPVYKQHIMEILMKKGYTDKIYGELFKKFKADGVFEKIKYIDHIEAMSILKEGGGLIFLAHPGTYDNWDVIPELVRLGLNGIEAYYKKHSQEEILRALEYTREYNLLVSGGSDFHGKYSEHPTELGVEVPDVEVNKFIKAIERL